MLDDFKDNSFYNYAVNLKKYYHAYLFEVEKVEDSLPLILAFSKMIICKNHYPNKEKCEDCNICHLIDNNYFSDLKIIEPDGMSIKKEQIMELQKELSLKSINDNNRVYIIKEASKMNSSSANSLLKFIEEPAPNIYGILITTNRKQILPTILSRCILISLRNNSQDEINKEDINNIVNFLKQIHQRKEEELPYLKTDFLNFYETRDDIIKAFNYMEVFLDFLLKKKYKTAPFSNFEFCDIIETNLSNLSLSDLVHYLDKIIKYKNKILNIPNINLNLLMDNFLISISEVIE